MGYCMHRKEIKFFIAKEDKGGALKRVKEMLQGHETRNDAGGHHFRYMDSAWLKAKTLEEMLEEWRWPAKLDDEGNIVGLRFEGEKLGDDLRFFGALAKFVVSGSYIHMIGDEGHHWRWVFEEGEVHEIDGEVIFRKSK